MIVDGKKQSWDYVMRWFSTPTSAANREVSFLAVIETVIAVSATVFLAVNVLHSWTHVAIMASVVPLMLLRTEESTNLALNWASRYQAFGSSYSPGVGILFITISPVCALAIRIAATLVCFVMHPLDALIAIPSNWVRNCLCVDLTHPPEIIPGTETSSEEISMFQFTRHLIGIKMAPRIFKNWTVFVGLISIILPIFFFLFIPAIIMRFSMKSTAIVWMPLLWIIPKATPKTQLETRLNLVNKSSWGRFVVFLSAGTVLLFTAKLLLYIGIAELASLWNNLSFAPSLTELIEPNAVPPWQIASLSNSLIAIGLFWFAGHQLILNSDSDSHTGLQKQTTDWTIRLASVIRSTLSLYTISCLLYIFIRMGLLVNWPPLGDNLFPWQ